MSLLCPAFPTPFLPLWILCDSHPLMVPKFSCFSEQCCDAMFFYFIRDAASICKVNARQCFVFCFSSTILLICQILYLFLFRNILIGLRKDSDVKTSHFIEMGNMGKLRWWILTSNDLVREVNEHFFSSYIRLFCIRLTMICSYISSFTFSAFCNSSKLYPFLPRYLHY